MYCTKCGHKLDNDALFCTRCGAPTGQIAGFVQPQMQPQPQPQPVQAVEAQPEVQSEVQPYYNEKVNVLFCILSVLFPLVGLIFYLVWADKKPKQAKYCGICTLTAVIAQLAAGIIIGLCVAGFAASGDNTAQGGYGGGSSNSTDLPGTHVPSTPSRVPDAAKYQDTDDGVLTFAYFGEGNNICYDNLTDSIIVWNGGWVGVYGRLDNELKYSFDYTLNVSAVSAYNGILCVGFGGAARQIAVINLQTGESHIEATDIFVEKLVVTDGLVVFCDADQWCNVVVLNLRDNTQTMVGWIFSVPEIAVNHEDKMLYLVETHISSSSFCYIDLKTLSVTDYAKFGQYNYRGGGVYYDGEYVHAFGNTYHKTNGKMIANCGYAENIKATDLCLINTLCRNGKCSLITEYDNCTVVCNNSTKNIVTTLNVNATQIYHVGDSIYVAVCGDSGYVGHLDLSTFKINGKDSGKYSAGKGGEVVTPSQQKPQKPEREPLLPSYTNSEDGVLTFTYFGKDNKICYDNASDSIIVWNKRRVAVYARTDNSLRHTFDYKLDVSAVSAYNGTLCVGFGGAARQIAVINLQTGESRLVTTKIAVEELVVTDKYAAFCDGDQWCTVVVLDLANLNQKVVGGSYYYPKLAVNHKDGVLYLVERDSSSSDFYYIDLNTLAVTEQSKISEYVYNSGGVYFDGEYVHAFGNTYDGVTGRMVANRGYAETVDSSGVYLLTTLLRNGKCSLISEYDNRTVVCDNQRVVYTMKLSATQIYHVGGEIYLAVCGDSGYVGHINLNNFEINGPAGSYQPGTAGTVEVGSAQKQVKPSRSPEAAAYNNTENGALTFISYGSGKNICYDSLSDSVIVWSGKNVNVYARSDNSQRYSFDYTANISGASAYNGVLCVGLGGNTKKIYVVDLQTGESKTVSTNTEVAKIAVSDGYAAFCDDDQWCTIVVLDLDNLTQRDVYGFYYPKIAFNHEKGILYVVETNLSSCGFYSIDIKTLSVTDFSIFGEYMYNYGGLSFDGDYVHAFGNSYDGITGVMVASNSGHAEAVYSSGLYLTDTLLRYGGYSFIAEYDNRTVVYDNDSKQIVYTLNLNATEIYHVSGEQYLAVCGDSGYVGLIDLSKI